jgi:dUTP pyrophosphatase
MAGKESLRVKKSKSHRVKKAKAKAKRKKAKIPTIKVNITGSLIPQYQSEMAAGCDLYADIAQPIVLNPGDTSIVPTGIRIEIPEGYEAQVRPRSGLALRKGIGILNAPGTIDADYRGEVKIILFNFGAESLTIKRGDRIAQMIFAPVMRAEFSRRKRLNKTKRGGGGFGHTGK